MPWSPSEGDRIWQASAGPEARCADPDYVGAVGFFEPNLPERRAVPAGTWDALVRRYHQRRVEYAELYDEMAALAQRPVGPGRFELGGRNNTVVFGYDAQGRRPVTGDHDLFDVRHSDGSRLAPGELLELIVAMMRRGMAVQHPAVRYWRPSGPDDIRRRDGITARHEAGGEPLVRFAPRRPVHLVDATTPVQRATGVPWWRSPSS